MASQVFLIIIFLGSAAGFGYMAFEQLFIFTAEAQATVTGEVLVSCDLEACYERADVTFSTSDGQQVTTRLGLPDGVATGDQITIYYDPENPVNARDGTARYFVFAFLGFVVFSLIFSGWVIRKIIRHGW